MFCKSFGQIEYPFHRYQLFFFHPPSMTRWSSLGTRNCNKCFDSQSTVKLILDIIWINHNLLRICVFGTLDLTELPVKQLDLICHSVFPSSLLSRLRKLLCQLQFIFPLVSTRALCFRRGDMQRWMSKYMYLTFHVTPLFQYLFYCVQNETCF